MFNRPNRNDVDDGVQDIQNDVNQLADSLESVLKSRAATPREAEAARSKAQALLKETGARMHGRTRVQQAARDAVGCADSLFVKDHGVVWVQRQRWVFYRRTVKHAQIVVQNDNKYASLTPKRLRGFFAR